MLFLYISVYGMYFFVSVVCVRTRSHYIWIVMVMDTVDNVEKELSCLGY